MGKGALFAGKLKVFGRINLQLLDNIVIIAEKATDGASLAGTGANTVTGSCQVVEKGVDIGSGDRLDDGKIQIRNVDFIQRLILWSQSAAVFDKPEEIAQIEIIIFNG